MIEIQSLKDIPLEMIYRAFSQAFMDYEMQLDQHELAKMLLRRGFDPGLSFGAFDQDRLVAFTFNGIGSYQGVQTAYDTGTGTVKEYRGQGLARLIFNQSIPYLKKAGIQRYLLEVLQHNEQAVKLYEKLGFEITREFYYFIQQTTSLKFDFKPLNSVYHMKPVDISELSELDYSDFTASWQNCHHSIIRSVSDFKAVAVYLHKEIMAYCIYEPESGDITSLAVAKAHRRAGLGSDLLTYALQNNPSDQVKVINIPVEEDGIVAFLSSFNILPSGKQFEMIREL
jgi:ribosomal protein S18 acetylase RimI-like enzyme